MSIENGQEGEIGHEHEISVQAIEKVVSVVEDKKNSMKYARQA